MATEFSNIDFGFRYGTQRAINAAAPLEGTFNIATDTGELYIDIGGSRVTMNKDIHLYTTEAEIRAIPEPGLDRLYFAKDTYRLFVYDQTNLRWVNAGGSPDEINARVDRLTAKVNSLHSFEIVILEEDEALPEEGRSNVVYFVPVETLDEDTKYEEFVWIAEGEYYEKIGITEADLGSYCKKVEIDAIIGADYPTDPEDINYKGVIADRLNTNEQNIGEIQAELGTLDSTSTGYIPVSDRITELEAKVGSTMDPSDTTGFITIDERLAGLENTSESDGNDIDELVAKFGTYTTSDATGFVSVEDRFNEIEAKLGSTMDPSSTTGFESVDTRLDTLESSASTAGDDITEIKAKLNGYPDSDSGSFISINSRFNEIEAKLGSTMDPSSTTGFESVDTRLITLETTTALASDLLEINNKLGAYPDSTDPDFVTINSKLTDIEMRLARLEEIVLVIAKPQEIPDPDPNEGE